MTTQISHPDACDIFRHRWEPHARASAGYAEETKSQTVVRLFRAERLNAEAGNLNTVKAARDERMRLLGKGGKP